MFASPTPVQILGEEVGIAYSRQQIKHLINIHVENPPAESGLTREDQQLLAGALDYKVPCATHLANNSPCLHCYIHRG